VMDDDDYDDDDDDDDDGIISLCDVILILSSGVLW